MIDWVIFNFNNPRIFEDKEKMIDNLIVNFKILFS